MIKAVLFDLDGLLVNTETLGIKSITKILKDLGVKLNKKEQNEYIGVSDQKFLEDLFKKQRLNYNINDVMKKHFKLYEFLLKNELKQFTGAISLPKKLKKKGFKLAIVSGSTRKQVFIILNKLKIKKLFDAIITCEDNPNKSKPNPEPYLFALRKLRLKPSECIVIEDSESGVKSAKKAGIKVIGVINKGRQNLSPSNKIVKNLNQISLSYFYPTNRATTGSFKK